MSCNRSVQGAPRFPLRRRGQQSNRNTRAKDISVLLQQQQNKGGVFNENQRSRKHNSQPAASESSETRTSKLPPPVTGIVHNPRRGIFYASELLYHKGAREYENEFEELEKVCIIRFPPNIAVLLRQRLAAHQAGLSCRFNEENVHMSQMDSSELGLSIYPTCDEDFRLFDVQVEMVLGCPDSTVKLKAVLVELPCLLEAYKSLEGELLFKVNDISQMIYVYDPSNPGSSFDIEKIRDSQLWEWHSGLSPGTHRIRARRFKNYNVFEKADVAAAEWELCKLINFQLPKEKLIVEAATEYDLECDLENIKTGQMRENVVAVIGPENPILKAALDETSLRAAAVSLDQRASLGPKLLRNYVENHAVLQQTFSERISVNNSSDLGFAEDDPIPDDLSDRLFGDAKADEFDILNDELLLEDEIAMGLGDDTVRSSSDASMSSDDNSRKEKKHRKKEKNENLEVI